MTPVQAAASSRRARRGGFTLVELLTAITILVFGIGALVSLVAATTAANRLNHETELALSGALGAIERLRGEPFEQLFARYDASPLDDPGGPGTAPGAGFAIPGLQAVAGDPDGLPGEIVLPAAGPELREDAVVADLGLPRDLDLDGAVDGDDHALDYRVLPVVVRVRWQGRGGPRTLRLVTSLGEW